MPIDPNIILRGMANMPDVNALLEQQITGMENINALERQRRADDLVMQDRAAAAAKEQEDAAVKALLPAYSYVLRTGDLAGGLKLAPAEYQDSLVPYMEALQGKSLPEIQAALTGSLVTSDVGRAFLENEARLNTAKIQQGQLDVSRGRLAFDTKQAAAEAARGPEASYKEIVLDDGTLMLMDTKSGKFIKPTMEGPIDTALPPDETTGEPIKVQTPEAKQEAKERIKLDAAFPKASRSFRSSVTALDQDIADVKALLADETGVAAITGTFNAMTPDIMRDATRAAALYDKITAGAAFTALSDLKAASPMGGALGNVSNEEGRRLRDSVATFSRKQATPDFVDGLERYLVDLEMARENVLAAFDETYAYRGDVNAASAAEDIGSQRERIEKETRSTQKPRLPPGVTIKKRN